MEGASFDLLQRGSSNYIVLSAILSNLGWADILEVVKAKTDRLRVEDEESGLMPFMMAAVEDNEDEKEVLHEEVGIESDLGLTMEYELLCMKPDVMNEYTVV